MPPLSEAKTEDTEVDGDFVRSGPEVSDPHFQRSGGQSRKHSGGLLPPAAISPAPGTSSASFPGERAGNQSCWQEARAFHPPQDGSELQVRPLFLSTGGDNAS